MPLPSNFRNGLASYGIPVTPFSPYATGQRWFVKPSSGSNGNSGKSPDQAVATVNKALDLATANRGDVIYLIGEGNSADAASSRVSETLTWNKDLTHLVGVAAPTMVSQRARIAVTSGASAMSPMVDVTANGCIFSNLQFFHGQASASALINVRVTGQRNVFEGVHFAGIGDATQSAAGAADLAIIGGAENVFRNCVIGLDTTNHDADATNLLFDTAATRNWFEDCLFQAYITAAGFASVTVADGTGIDRWQVFKNCVFQTDSVNKGVTQTQVMSIPAIVQGKIILWNSYYNTDGASGSGVWDNTGRGIIWNNSVAAAAAAAGGEMTKL